jgi:predicted O-methyltransferase YrrM
MPTIYHSQAVNVKPGQQHVFIAMPIGQPTDAAMMSFMWETSANLQAAGIAADFYILAGHCHVDDSRNFLVWEFLRTQCTDFLFIDADTASSEDAVARILSYDRDVIAGAYPYKGDEESYPIRLLDWQSAPKYEDDGSIEVEAVPTGFLRIRRAALEKVEATCPAYWNKEVSKLNGDRPVPLMFERSIEFKGETFEGRPVGDRWGGDYGFSRKWRALGGKVYIDPTLGFRHYGTKAYQGTFAPHLARARGVQTPAFDHAIDALRAGNPMTAHFGRLYADWGNQYAAPPDLQSAIYWVAREAKGPILETGSGLSTLILGIAAEAAGVQVHALEHEPDYYRSTMAALKRHGIKNVRLHYAPLRVHPYQRDDDGKVHTCLWYEIPHDLPAEFSMVLCDGPQQRFGRAGLFKVIPERTAGAKILMDDAENMEKDATLAAISQRTGRKFNVVRSGMRAFAVSLPANAA